MPYKDPKAHREYMRKYRQRPNCKNAICRTRCRRTKEVNEETKGRKNHRKPWTEQEIVLLWKETHTTRALAALLHRTYHAISMARRRFATKRPEGYCHNGTRKHETGGCPTSREQKT